MKKLILTIFGLCISFAVFFSCKNDNNDLENDFDRKVMLENIANNLIKPAFQDLQTQVNALKTATDNFIQNVNATNLTALQTAWENAYTAWQFANAYNFGPAGEEGTRKGLIEEIGTFPVSTSKIETAITNNSANFNDFNRDARGFLTVEYLLFDLNGNNTKIVNDFASENRKTFLAGAVNNLKSRIDEVVLAWNGTFLNEFINNVGTDVGSSTSKLYNEFVKSYESIKNFKVGLPLGKRPGQTQAEPTLVEAYYSGKSRKMIEHHLIAIENIWRGKSKSDIDGIGFREYLDNVEGGNALISSTETQLTAVKNALNLIPESPHFANQITTNFTVLDNFHTELQKHTRFFKSDMSSLLGISITFSSGDGD